MDSKTVLAFILIGVIIILMPYYYKMILPERPEVAERTEVSRDTLSTVVEKVPVQAIEASDTVDVGISEYYESAWEDTTDLEEKQIKVETPYYIAIFSTAGAKLISFKLKEYIDRRGGITEMIKQNPIDGSFYPNAYLTFPQTNVSTNRLRFSANVERIDLQRGESGKLVFSRNIGNGGTIRLIYNFNGDNYRIGLRTVSDNVRLGDEYYFRWDGGVNITETDTVQDLTYSKAYAFMGGELVKFDAKSQKEHQIRTTGRVDWIAVRSKYFEIAVVPKGNSMGIDFSAKKIQLGKYGHKEFDLALKMSNTGRKLDQEYILFLGPMDSDRLVSLGVGLEATMNWGWSIIKPFSKFILWSFKHLHKLIPNYGVVIIVFSVLIKVVLWPLTHKSYSSMKKMQALQPYLKEIKEKYKGDAQRMQKETAKLYKEHKVNPMGGCLPMLLQMPLLYGLFIVFRSTIELRGAPFVLWIKDLSLPDTIFNLGFSIPMYGSQVALLPLVMGATTYFQSKATMTDPNQKMMLYFMPIFLTLLFNNFPSGLTLYYTLFNLLSMVQQRMVHNKDDK